MRHIFLHILPVCPSKCFKLRSKIIVDFISVPRKFLLILLTLICLIIFFAGCENTPTGNDIPENVDVSQINMLNYPLVDGSTSAHPLQVLIACKLLDVEYNWYDWEDGSRHIWPSYNDTTKRDRIDFIEQKIQHFGTHEAYVNLIGDSTDLILVARLPSKDEDNLAKSLGVQLEARSIALDALVFLLNSQNPINNLTTKQIIQIYSGAIRNWKETGGADAVINPYQREKNSGSQELMESLVMKGTPMVIAPTMVVFSMMGPINKLMQDPNGMGYTVYFFGKYMAPRPQIKFCAVDGVFPEYATLCSGSYSLVAPVYLVIRSNLNRASTAFRLWQWLQTTAGQAVVQESGFVPVG